MNRSHAWPLSRVLIIPFVLIVLLAVGVTGYVSWVNGERSLKGLVGQLSDQAASRVRQHLDDYLNKPYIANKATINAIQLGLIDPRETQQLQRHLWHQLSTLRDVNTIQLGTAQGEYYGAGWTDANVPVQKIANKETGYSFNTHYINEKGELADLASSHSGYDPRERPWYVEAKESRSPAWSPVYVMFSHEELGITLSEPLYAADGEIKGVVGTDILLSEISNFLQNLHVSSASEVYIVDRWGQLVATGSKDRAIWNKKTGRIKATDSSNILVSNSAKHALQALGEYEKVEHARHLSYRDAEQENFITITPYNDPYGLNWLITVVVPEGDFLAEAQSNTRTTVILSLVAALVAIFIGSAITLWITYSIEQLRVSIKAMQGGELDFKSREQSILEFRDLADSFSRLSWKLKQSFAEITDTNARLELKVNERTQELKEANQVLKEMSRLDGLTQVANRRRFDEYFATQWELMSKDVNNLPIALIVCDVDYFKKFNDGYGHQAGDEALKRVASCIQKAVRAPSDLLARYGGEEFVVVLPGASLSSASRAAEQIIKAVQEEKIEHRFSDISDYLTVSLGVASVRPAITKYKKKDLFNDADQALYKAKQSGRNRQVCADAPSDESSAA